MRPRTRYTKAGDVHIAYQVLGGGPIDLVVVPGVIGHVDLWWEDAGAARFFERLAAFARLIVFDKRGIGASDRSSEWAPLEERMDDLRAVLHAAGAIQPAVLGVSEGGPMCLLFAASHPERCRALCVVGGFARLVRSDDYPHGYPTEVLRAAFESFVARWGEPALIDALAPSIASDPERRAAWGRFERAASNPAAVRAAGRMFQEVDLRPVLPQIRVPTLVMHASGDLAIPVGVGRYLAQHIPGARYLEYESRDHAFWLSPDAIADGVQKFLTGSLADVGSDRVLATVLFVDVVRSTQLAAELGDAAWADVQKRYRERAREALARFRGRELDDAGDGFFAAFDGPGRAVRCAAEIRDAVRELGLEVRAGVHTGECQRAGAKLSGIAVHIGARIAAAAAPSEVLVSGTVHDLVTGSGLSFDDLGPRQLRGVPGEWRLFALRD